MTKTKPPREEIPAGEYPCDYCSGKCCRYFALPIDTPDSRRDLDFMRWYLLHVQATVFVEDDDWYLMVHTKCKHLLDDNRCGIYEERPQICREYKTDICEYEDDWTYDRYFETPEQVEEYIEAVCPKKPGESTRSRKPALLPVVAG